MTETLLQTAERIARQAHAGQRDLVGDYHCHLERVAALVEGDEAKAVAWLHDVLEDTTVTASDLLAAGISVTVVEAVRILTRVRPDVYQDYIQTVIDNGSPAARAVKLADLRDHLRPIEHFSLPDAMRRKYERALVAFMAVDVGA